MAHNGAGYDFKFILKWCVEHGMLPQKYIKQNVRIPYMSFKTGSIRFVDTYSYFLKPLRQLPEVFGITDVEKGHFHIYLTLQKIRIM